MYTEQEQREFADAFYGTMQILVPEFDMDEDLKTPYPWGCPWLVGIDHDKAPTPEESGIMWAHACAPTISRALEMEQEARETM